MEVKAITLWQPWASAVACGLKRYETRSWSTRYRGLILIHAAKRWTLAEQYFQAEAAYPLTQVYGHRAPEVAAICDGTPPLGRIVAVADLVECLPTEGVPGGAMTDLERLFGDFSAQRWAWQLENVIRLAEPIPCRGAQGLWTPPGEIVELVMEMHHAPPG